MEKEHGQTQVQTKMTGQKTVRAALKPGTRMQ